MSRINFIHMKLTRDVTYERVMLHVRHDSFKHLTWIIHIILMRDVTYERVIPHVNGSCQTCRWVMAHIYTRKADERSCHIMSHVTSEWVISHMWMSHVAHIHRRTKRAVTSHNESCYIWMSHVTHLNESCHTCEWVMSHMWMSHVTHVNESCHTCKCMSEAYQEACLRRGGLITIVY